MDIGIRPLWGTPRLAGPAYTVRCAKGDNLMLHTAIYRAEPGSVIVVQSGDLDYALAGGNVCAIAHRRGIAGFVLDGLVRDIGEVRELGFPVYGRGVIPKPGGKSATAPLNQPVTCGGVTVHAGDVLVADEDGVAVVPAARAGQVLADARPGWRRRPPKASMSGRRRTVPGSSRFSRSADSKTERDAPATQSLSRHGDNRCHDDRPAHRCRGRRAPGPRGQPAHPDRDLLRRPRPDRRPRVRGAGRFPDQGPDSHTEPGPDHVPEPEPAEVGAEA